MPCGVLAAIVPVPLADIVCSCRLLPQPSGRRGQSRYDLNIFNPICPWFGSGKSIVFDLDFSPGFYLRLSAEIGPSVSRSKFGIGRQPLYNLPISVVYPIGLL